VALSQYPRSAEGKPVMGYSARDSRWRLTVWRDRTSGATVATELYDEKNDPKESVNVASKPENAAVIAELTRELDAAYAGLGAPIPTTKNAKTPQKAASDRVALFNRKDTNKDDQLTYDEFMANQADPEQAKERFKKFDTNNDGKLSRDEFIKQGK
jgi:iduronate 2-sulfatase